MRNLFTRGIFLKIVGLFLALFLILAIFRSIVLYPRVFRSGTTVEFTAGTLQEWTSQVRYLRRLAGIYADSFILSGAEKTRFQDDYVAFESRGLSTYIDIPLKRRINAEDVEGVQVVMSFVPDLQEDEQFLKNIGRYYSRAGIALGDDFEYTMNVPLKAGEEWQKYDFFLAGFSEWRGHVDALRIIPALGPGLVRIKEISFLKKVPPESLKLHTASINNEDFYLTYLSDVQDTPGGIIPLENQLKLAFLETPSLPAENMNQLSLDIQYDYEQPDPYLLFINTNGMIVHSSPLKKNDGPFETQEQELSSYNYDYLGLYLPPDASDKLIQDMVLKYEDIDSLHVALLPRHNNALMGDRNNFVIFLTRRETTPHFVQDLDMNIRYINKEYFRQSLNKVTVQMEEVSKNIPRIKVQWQKKECERTWILPFPYPSSSIFLGKHSEYSDNFGHMEFVLENFYGPVKIQSIRLNPGTGKTLTHNELAEIIFLNGILFDNHGDCNAFDFIQDRYVVEARLEKGRIWSHQFPLVPEIMNTLRIHYRLKGDPLVIRTFQDNDQGGEAAIPIETYNQPHRLRVSLPDLEAPLTGVQIVPPLKVNWGKLENISLSGKDIQGERHYAVLTGTERMMPGEELAQKIWNEIAEGEFLLLEDMQLVKDIRIGFDYTYTPNNRPYFYWFCSEQGQQVHYLDGIRADGQKDEIVIPLKVTEADILPVWGLSLFWCPGTLEIIEVELK